MKPITLKLVKYNLQTRQKEDAEEYARIKERAAALGYRLMDVSNPSKYHNLPDVVEIDTVYLFNNQYNTKCGHRVHDWYEGIDYRNRTFKSGYYLDADDDSLERLKQAKLEQLACGYCGDHSGVAGQKFCSNCLGSPYLKEDSLYLLRLIPVLHDHGKDPRAELTPEELAQIKPLYVEAQSALNIAAEKARREDLQKEFDRTTRKALTKFSGFTWLLDHGINTTNVIYYDHTDKFSFGWQGAMEPSVQEVIKAKMVGFPFNWEFAKAK